MIGSCGLPFDVAGVLFLQDTGPNDPDATLGTAAIFTTNGVTYYRDVNGVKFPLVPGAGGAGVVFVTTATYTVQDSDELILVDSSAAIVTITFPATVTADPERTVIQLGANNVVLNGGGNNINGNPTLTMNALRSVRKISGVTAFGAVTAQYIVTGSVG